MRYPELLDRLRREDAEARLATLRELLSLPDPFATPAPVLGPPGGREVAWAVMAALRDPDAAVRAHVVVWLERVTDATTFTPLGAALADAEVAARAEALRALLAVE